MIVIKAKIPIVETILVVLTLALLINVSSSLAVKVNGSTPHYSEQVIVIDAGHGDFDPGKVASDGTNEKDINLSIALKLYELFRSNGYATVLTRNSDLTLANGDAKSISERKKTDTHNRTKLADSFSDSVLISIHQNSFSDSSQHGTQAFFGTLNEDSERLAETIVSSVVKNLQPDNKRPLKKGTSSIYILVNTKAPTVLVECGFMTNGEELSKLKDEEYQKKLAYAIYLGYLDYLSLPEQEATIEENTN